MDRLQTLSPSADNIKFIVDLQTLCSVEHFKFGNVVAHNSLLFTAEIRRAVVERQGGDFTVL